MGKPYTRRLSAEEWYEARLFWEQNRKVNADAVAAKFGTSRAAVRHRITREVWTRGFRERVAPIADLCRRCFDREVNRSVYVTFLAPFPARKNERQLQADDLSTDSHDSVRGDFPGAYARARGDAKGGVR